MVCERKLLESEATTGFFVLLGTKRKKETLEWCVKANLIASRYECPRCKKEMRLQERKGTVDGYKWRCRSQSKDNPHNVVRSVRKGTWFSESKLAITIILRLTRYWFGKSMNAFVVNDDLTVTSWWMTIFMNSLHPSQGCIHQRNMKKCKRKIFLGIPTINQRKEILKALTKSYLCEIDYERIAGLIPGFLPCDIVRLIQETVNLKTRSIHAKEDSKDNKVICLTTRDFEIALPSISPSVLKTSEWNLRVKPVYWKDIGGVQKIKERLQMSIELPLSHPEIFEKVDLHCPRGVLLFGPPGCCKTTLARGLATECNANFFAANPSQIYSSYVGESEKNIAQLFYQARISAPSIIFLDELDSLVGYRNLNSKQQGVAEKVLSTLLNEMDGLGIKIQSAENLGSEFIKINSQVEENDVHHKHSNDDVIVVAATNRPDCIDDALLRPGRFDIILYVPPPNSEERESILQTITDGMPLQDINFKKIVEKTNNFTGADLKNLCNMAAMNSLKEDILKATYITEKHFMQALEKNKLLIMHTMKHFVFTSGKRSASTHHRVQDEVLFAFMDPSQAQNNNMSKTLSLALHKVLTGIGGEPKSVKRLRFEACKFIVPQLSQTYAQAAKPLAISTTTQTDPDINVICPP
ncbi:spermatogenesis-associated protein 5-like protein 1 [Trichonephila clavipes]|nr:spermatogenesis-associated protein 5-like protein 1 [Trichonephila clavipes]